MLHPSITGFLRMGWASNIYVVFAMFLFLTNITSNGVLGQTIGSPPAGGGGGVSNVTTTTSGPSPPVGTPSNATTTSSPISTDPTNLTTTSSPTTVPPQSGTSNATSPPGPSPPTNETQQPVSQTNTTNSTLNTTNSTSSPTLVPPQGGTSNATTPPANETQQPVSQNTTNSTSSPSPPQAPGGAGSGSGPGSTPSGNTNGAPAAPVTFAVAGTITGDVYTVPSFYNSAYSPSSSNGSASWWSYSILYTKAWQLPVALLPLRTTSSGSGVALRLQVGWAPSFGVVALNDYSCGAVASSASITTHGMFGQGTCGSLATCASTPTTAHATDTAATGGNVSGLVRSFNLSIGTSYNSAAQSACAQFSFYGTLLVAQQLVLQAVHAFVSLELNTTAISAALGATNGSSPTDAAVAAYIASSGRWRGTSSVFLSRTAAEVTLQRSLSSQPSAMLYPYLPSDTTTGSSNASDNTRTLVLNSSSTALSSECIVHTVSLYTMELSTATTILDYYHDCDSVYYDGSITDLPSIQAACNADAACVGFTTYALNVSNGVLTEVPYCLLRSGSSDQGFGYPRMVYLKLPEANRTCAVTTARSGTLEVWVEQTSSSTTTVDVYVNGFHERRCGMRSNAFASGVSGTSGSCGTFNLCFSGRTYHNAVVTVVPAIDFSVGSSAASCSGALHVIFNQASEDAVSVADTREQFVMPATLAANFSTRYTISRAVTLTSATDTTIRLYTRYLQSAALGVYQTAYGCSGATGACGGKTTVVTFGSINAATGLSDNVGGVEGDQACGGTSGFDAYPGLTDQCSTLYYCGGELELATQRSMQWLTVGVDMAAIAAAGSASCPYFSGVVYAMPVDVATILHNDSLYGFPLVATPSTFRLLLAAPVGTTTAQVADLAFDNGTHIPEIILLEGLHAGPLNSLSVFYVDWAEVGRSSFLVGGSALQQACVMDWISADPSACTFVVPPGANHLVLRVEQSNYALADNCITVNFNKQEPLSNRVSVASTMTCGGTDQFSGVDPYYGACGVYLNCTSQFLYDDGTDMTSDPIVSITAKVVAAVSAGQPCDASAILLAEFSFINLTQPSNCQFYCSSSRTCLAYDNVCDGINDCSDASDEVGCSSTYSVMESDMTLNATVAATFSKVTFLQCVRRALSKATQYFAYSSTTRDCTLFANVTTQLLATTSAYVNTSGVSIYRAAGAPVSRCTSNNTCSSHGDVVTIQGICTCFCYDGYYGPQCDTLLQMTSFGGVFVSFAASSAESAVGRLTLEVAAVLKLVVGDDFQCDTVARDTANSSRTNFFCHSSSASSLSAFLDPAAALLSFNAQLKPEFSSAVSTGLFSVPVFQPIPTCTLSSNASCAMTSDVGIKSAVVKWQQVGTPGLTVSVTTSTTSRRRLGAATTTAFSCDSSTTVVVEPPLGPGCATFSCILPIGIANVESLTAVIAPTNVSSPQCTPAVTSVSYASLLTVSAVASPTQVANVYADYRSFLIGGIVSLVAGFVVFVFSSTCFALDRRVVRSLTYETEIADGLSSLHRMLRLLFIRMGYYLREDVFVRHERWSVALVVVAVNLLIAGGFMVIYFATAFGFSSDTSMIVEEYLSSQCDDSTTSTLAFSVFVIEQATALSCTQRQLTGSSTTALFASGYCSTRASDGAVMANIKIATSSSACSDAAYVTVESGMCVSMLDVAPTTAINNTYVRVRCGRTSAILSRLSSFEALATGVSQSATIAVEALPTKYEQNWDNTALVHSAYYEFSAIAAGAVVATTSVNRYRFVSAAPGSFDGASLKQRLITMDSTEAFQQPTTSNYFAKTSALEAQSWKFLTNTTYMTSVGASVGPLNGDLPLGHIYNRFNTTNTLSGTAASSQATRYFGVSLSPVDIGANFGESSSPSDGDGVTITMYLRADAASLGFAFAVTDAYENVVTHGSPILDTAIDMITQNSPSDSWFASSYHIYSSLFVNGADRTLHFIHANPKTLANGNASTADAAAARFVNIKWNLQTLGLTRLLNGLWHHVAIILRSENKQTKAQLVVDGETSLSTAGWNQCMSRRPTAIQAVAAGTLVPAYSAASEVFVAGGELFAGYFNGGLGHLQFRSYVVPQYALWLESTHAVQAHNAVNTVKFTALGAVLIAAAVCLLLFSVVSSGVVIYRERKEDEARAQAAAKRAFDQALGPRRRECPLSAADAAKLLSLNTSQFLLFLAEVETSYRDHAAELLRILDEEHRKRLIDAENEAVVIEGVESVMFDNQSDDSDLAERRQDGGEVNTDEATAQQTADNKESTKDPVAGTTTDTAAESNGIAAQLSMNSSLTSGLVTELTAPVLLVIQTVYVWIGVIPFPQLYTVNLRAFFSFVSVDWTVAFSMPTFVTPLLQFFVGMVVFAFIVYHVKMDEYRFAWYLARYTLRRDQQIRHDALATLHRQTLATQDDTTVRQKKRKSVVEFVERGSIDSIVHDVTARFPHPFGKTSSCGYEYTVDVFPLAECKKVDCFIGKSEVEAVAEVTSPLSPGDRRTRTATSAFAANTDASVPPSLHRRESIRVQHHLTIHDAFGVEYQLEKPLETPRGGVHLQPVESCKLQDVHVSVVVAVVDDEVAPREESNDHHGGGDVREPEASARFGVVDLDEEETIQPTGAEPNRSFPARILHVDDRETAQPSLALDVVGVCCREHSDRRLMAAKQTAIVPFAHAPSCCVAIHGRRCGTSRGVLYVCGKKSLKGDGSVSRCEYAVCERHMRLTPVDLVVNALLAVPRRIEDQGDAWAIATLALLVANAAYTPFMQTALMILACAPYYQCEFEHCWTSGMDQKFTLAVYLCVAVVVLLGVGLPVLQTLQLRRCRKLMETVFFAPEYEGLYQQDGSSSSRKAAAAAAGSPVVQQEQQQQQREDDEAQKDAAAAFAFATPTASPQVSQDEWIRFTETDPTVMGSLYKSLRFDWLFTSPILLAWKVVLIVPAVFIPSDTFEQRVGIAAAQVAFSMFIFIVSPFLSPVVDAMYRLGCVHQLLFLGVEALNYVAKVEGGSGFDTALLAITMTYLGIALLMMFSSSAYPILRRVIDNKVTTGKLRKLGLIYSPTTTLYTVPNKVKRREIAVEAEDSRLL